MAKKQPKLLLLNRRLSAWTISLCHLQSRNSQERRTPETKRIMIVQKITHFRQSSLPFCNSELSLYAEKNFHFSFSYANLLLDGKLLSRSHIFCNTGNFEERWKIGFYTTIFCKASWDLQLSGAPPVVESTLQLSGPGTYSCRKHPQFSGVSKEPTVVWTTYSCREHLQLSRAPSIIQSTPSCREHLHLSKVPPVVENASSCREHLQLPKVSPVVESTSSCPKYLRLSKVSPVVESTSSCPKYLHLSKVPPVVESDFCQTGSVINFFSQLELANNIFTKKVTLPPSDKK